MDLLASLLEVKTMERTTLQIIGWWELRRFLFNCILLVAGVLSILIMKFASSFSVDLEPGQDFYEPIMIPAFAILCNGFYTLGWFTEIIIERSMTYGPKMFRRGLYFTLFWIFLPSAIWIVIGIRDLIYRIL